MEMLLTSILDLEWAETRLMRLNSVSENDEIQQVHCLSFIPFL